MMTMGNLNANLRTFPLTSFFQAGGRSLRCALTGSTLLLAVALSHPALAQAPTRSPSLTSPSDEQSYRTEFVFGVNFNTQGGLIGGASVRSARVLDERWLRFWSLEGVMLKNNKELQMPTQYGSVVSSKVNYAFSLRPSFGVQRVLFRKAADSGVQVNALLSAGPSLGLLLPYYISYDYTISKNAGGQVQQDDDVRDEQYNPNVHTVPGAILDRAPIFSGIGNTKVVPGAHLRAALSFEYGRYRDAVAGLETGFMVEAFTKEIVILQPSLSLPVTRDLNKRFFPSVYLTLYFGHRS